MAVQRRSEVKTKGSFFPTPERSSRTPPPSQCQKPAEDIHVQTVWMWRCHRCKMETFIACEFSSSSIHPYEWLNLTNSKIWEHKSRSGNWTLHPGFNEASMLFLCIESKKKIRDQLDLDLYSIWQMQISIRKQNEVERKASLCYQLQSTWPPCLLPLRPIALLSRLRTPVNSRAGFWTVSPSHPDFWHHRSEMSFPSFVTQSTSETLKLFKLRPWNWASCTKWESSTILIRLGLSWVKCALRNECANWMPIGQRSKDAADVL